MRKLLTFLALVVAGCAVHKQVVVAPMPKRTSLPPPLLVAPVPTKSVKLAWDWPYDYSVLYRLYQGGQSGNYTNIASVATNTVTVGGLLPKTTYYFAVKAYSGTEESDYTNEINYRVPNTRVKLVTQQGALLNGQWSTVATNYHETDAPSGFYRLLISTDDL